MTATAADMAVTVAPAEGKAERDAVNKDGETPLSAAVNGNHRGGCAALIMRGDYFGKNDPSTAGGAAVPG